MSTEWGSEDTPEFVTRISVGTVRVRELPTTGTELFAGGWPLVFSADAPT